jgi:hypothetical protein
VWIINADWVSGQHVLCDGAAVGDQYLSEAACTRKQVTDRPPDFGVFPSHQPIMSPELPQYGTTIWPRPPERSHICLADVFFV